MLESSFTDDRIVFILGVWLPLVKGKVYCGIKENCMHLTGTINRRMRKELVQLGYLQECVRVEDAA